MKKKETKKARTRWGCLIAALIVVLLIGGFVYLFFIFIYPVLVSNKVSEEYTSPVINKEGDKVLEDATYYGDSIKDNESTGRSDPFAPF